MIECGFITNDKDLAYISNSSNQETIAQKILEGIVSYKNKPVAVVNTPATRVQTGVQTVRVEKPAKPATPATPAIPVMPTSNTLPVATTAVQAILNDSTLDKLARHYRRNVWYPKQAVAQKAEGVVYFSVMVNKNGELNNFQVYEQVPAEASQPTKIIVVSFMGANEVAATTTEQLSKEELTKVLQSVMKTASDKKPNLSGCTPQSTPYFFQVNFRLEKTKAPTV